MTKQADPSTKVVKVITKAELARRKGVTRSAVTQAASPGGPLAAARVAGGFLDEEHPACVRWLNQAPATSEWLASELHHVSVEAFASLCGVDAAKVQEAARRSLRPAVTAQGLIDVGHRVALAFAAKHPADFTHPLAKHYFARCLGYVPTKADLAAQAAPSSGAA
jgi:hypothetical protein